MTALMLAAIMGTLTIALAPSLHTPFVGLIWTSVLMILVSAIFYWQLRSQLDPKHLWILLLLRIIAVILLVPMLFEPVIRWISKPPADRPLVLLVDTSGSMSFPDVQNGPTRIQSVDRALTFTMDDLRRLPSVSRVHFVECHGNSSPARHEHDN